MKRRLSRTVRIALDDLSGKANPLLCFRAYPDSKHGLFFVVRIWESAASMWRGVPSMRGAFGFCRTATRYVVRPRKRSLYSKCAGTINLCLGYLQPYIVVHEVSHAALAWARRTRLDIADTDKRRRTHAMHHDCGEERFCYAMGRLYRTINLICHNAGYYAVKRTQGRRMPPPTGPVRARIRF